MRVLALTNLYPSPVHPLRAPFNRHQLRLLAEEHEVRVICPIAWTDEWAARRRGALSLSDSRRVERDGLTVDHPRYWFPPRVLRRSYGWCFERSVRAAFRRAVNEFQPDVVFAPWVFPDGWAAIRLARAVNLPAVLQAHGSDVLLLDNHPSRRQPTAEAVREADGIVAVSRDLKRRLVRLGAEPDRVRVVHDGVDPDWFHPGPMAVARAKLGVADGDPLVLFVGNLVPVKGLDFMLAAAEFLKRDGARFRIKIIGQGPLRGVLERDTARRGLADRVEFLGGLPQDRLPDWYRAADLFVLPSRSEGVPNVLLEASACGTPWVAGRVGGIPEVADRGCSRLVAVGDVPALAAAIRDMLRVPRNTSVTAPRLRRDAVAELGNFLQECTHRGSLVTN